MRCHSFFQNFAPPFSVEQVGMEAPACFPTNENVFALLRVARIIFESQMANDGCPKRSTICTDIYEIRPRANKDGVDLVSDALPYSPLWYCGPNAIRDAIGHIKFFSRSHDTVIRVYDDAGNVIETHEHKGEFKEPLESAMTPELCFYCSLIFRPQFVPVFQLLR